MCSSCCVADCIMCLFTTVPWVGMLSVILAFPGHIHMSLKVKVKQKTMVGY